MLETACPDSSAFVPSTGPHTWRRQHRVVLAVVAISIVAIDVATKVWASSSLPGRPRTVGPLTLRLVHNRGVALGVGSYLPAWAIVAVTATVAVVVAVAGWRRRLEPAVAAGLIVGGAIANVADRLTGGSVVDFLDVGRWPVFNFADVSVIVGLGLLLPGNDREPTSTGAHTSQPEP